MKIPPAGYHPKWVIALIMFSMILLPAPIIAKTYTGLPGSESIASQNTEKVLLAFRGQGFHLPADESSDSSVSQDSSNKFNFTLEKKMPVFEESETTEAPSSEGSFEELEDPFAEDPLPELRDPLVGYNRFMHRVNDGIYDNFIDPVANVYKKIVHEKIRVSVRNMFRNAMAPARFVSSLAQGNLDKSARVLGRLVINSTVGLAGLFDVAKHYEIESVSEDFGQTLGYHGVPTGPYLVLPLIGPSHARDVAGKVVDSFLSPTIFLAPGFAVGTGMNTFEKLNEASLLLDDKKELDESALDEYESMRDFYHQFREGQVKK